MSGDGAFSATGYCRSPVSGRLYLVNNGFIIGEVPSEAESLIPPEQIQPDLASEIEIEYLRRHAGNLVRYKADLEQFRRPELAAALVLRGAADFRVAGLLTRHVPSASLPPRLVQLGNLGCYAYAHVGWRYVIRPAPNELAILKRVPVPVLIADAGIPLFVQRERGEVLQELEDARRFMQTLGDPGAGAASAA